MNILAIETSCDETAAAVYNSRGLQSNIIASQTIHQPFGGVVPELASREHIRAILPIIRQALATAGLSLDQIQGLAVTYGPGLAGSLLIGLNTAKALAYAQRIPWIGVNHVEGHVFSICLTHAEIELPFLALVVSGGHTQLVLVKKLGDYQVLGRTLDDAAGEAFDKVAKMLELGYPGGPIIDRLAAQGDETRIAFPRSLLKEPGYHFSFSGLKTAVLYYLKGLSEAERREQTEDIVASFQAALVEVLVEKTIMAAREWQRRQIVVAGGVARNSYLRQRFQQRGREEGIEILIPEPIFCTDNAAMIAWVGYQKLQLGLRSDYHLAPMPGLQLGEAADVQMNS